MNRAVDCTLKGVEMSSVPKAVYPMEWTCLRGVAGSLRTSSCICHLLMLQVVLRLPGNADLEEVEEDVPPTAAGSAELEEHPNGQQAQKPGAVVGDVLGVGGGVDPGLEARETLQAAEQVPDVFKDVFGDDDDDF